MQTLSRSRLQEELREIAQFEWLARNAERQSPPTLAHIRLYWDYRYTSEFSPKELRLWYVGKGRFSFSFNVKSWFDALARKGMDADVEDPAPQGANH